jgi:CarboxypepD_reg-like domain/TonB-dependent Receptor Plug Domain
MSLEGVMVGKPSLIVIAAVVSVTSIPRWAVAQGTVRGLVTHELTRDPVYGAQVQFETRRIHAVTDSAGRFVLSGIPAGIRELRVSRIGYQVAVVQVEILEGDTVGIEVVLSPVATRLRDIVVTPGRFGVLDAPIVSQQTVTREEIETIPQVGEDVFRAIKHLPGLTAGDISTRLNVRGGTDRELLVMLDGVELYEPYHLKDFDGVLGIVDVYSVGGIDLATGGFGVEHGDHTAGVFAMTSRIPPTTGTRTTLSLSIMNASVTNQGAWGNGKGQWLLSARRGYLDVALKLTGGDDNLSPVYWDVFGKVQYQANDRHRIGVTTLHAFDDLNYSDFDEDGSLSSTWGSHYAWTTWDAQWSDHVATQTTVFAGHVSVDRGGWYDELDRIRGPEQAGVSDARAFNFIGGRTDLTWSLNEHAMIKVGGEAKRQQADYRYHEITRSVSAPDGTVLEASFDSLDVDLEPTGNEMGGYTALRLRPVDPLVAEIGVRYDRIGHTSENNVGPRILASYDVGPRTTVRASWGRYHQSHGLHQLDVGDGETTFYPSDRADQIAVGLEHFFGDVSVRIEGYRRQYADQRPRYLSLDREIDPFIEVEWDRVRIDPGKGLARGIEFLIRRDTGRRWAWSASYALSEAKDLVGEEWVPRTLDQRHALTLNVAYRPNGSWSLSAGVYFHTGWPITEAFFSADTLSDGSVTLRRFYGRINAERLPPYHRIDFRVTRGFPLGRGLLQAYVDLFNLYNRTNLRSYFYWARYENGVLSTGREAGETLLPLLPSLGFRWEF